MRKPFSGKNLNFNRTLVAMAALVIVFAGIERVNSCTLLLINPARKKNTIKIKINNKAIAIPCGTLRCVIALITGEQIMAINNANRKGTTISAASLIPANTITKAAIATTVRLKFKFFSH